jgi:hypothetical protein
VWPIPPAAGRFRRAPACHRPLTVPHFWPDLDNWTKRKVPAKNDALASRDHFLYRGTRDFETDHESAPDDPPCAMDTKSAPVRPHRQSRGCRRCAAFHRGPAGDRGWPARQRRTGDADRPEAYPAAGRWPRWPHGKLLGKAAWHVTAVMARLASDLRTQHADAFRRTVRGLSPDDPSWSLAVPHGNGETRAHFAAERGELPGGGSRWDTTDQEGWTITHAAAWGGKLPADFD